MCLIQRISMVLFVNDLIPLTTKHHGPILNHVMLTLTHESHGGLVHPDGEAKQTIRAWMSKFGAVKHPDRDRPTQLCVRTGDVLGLGQDSGDAVNRRS